MRPQPGTSIAPLLAALALGSSALCARAAAEPSLHVRAATRIELHTRSEAAGLRVTGALRDDLDSPLAGRTLQLRVEPGLPGEASAAADGGTRTWTRKLRSDAAGQFEQLIPLPLGRYRVLAEYAGDATHERTGVERALDVALAEVTLELRLPGGRAISLDQERYEVELRASVAGNPAALPIRLRDERGRELARGQSDANGHWRATLPTAALGEPGAGQLLATTPADAQHAAGEVEAKVMRERSSELTLHATWDETRDALHLSGELRTRAGPLSGKAVGLYLDRHHAITMTTDTRGHFEHELTAQDDASGLLAREQRDREQTRHASARFDSDAPGLAGSQAGELPVRIPAWPGPNLLWVLLPSLLSLIGVGLWLRRASAWFGPAEPPDVFAPGVQLGAAAQWRVASLRGLDGVIEDAETGARLRHAQLTLALERGEGRGGPVTHGSVPVGADGSFSASALVPGVYRVEAGAPGYALATSELRVPHAGEGSGLRVRLRSLRTLALEAHRPLVRHLFGTREQQLSATPREVLQRAGSAALPPLSASGGPVDPSAADALAALTDLVECTAYAPGTPTPEQVDTIERRTNALIKRSV